MGIPVLTAARIFSVGEEGSLTIDTLPETAFVRTYSRDSRVTDSAPSMSAYTTGVKMNNDVIAMTAETPFNGTGRAVPTILEWAKAAGWGTGVVTTTRVTHATPAACYAHTSNRDLENLIARQLVPGGDGANTALGDGLDVIFGGGSRHFLPSSVTGGLRTDGRNLVDELRAKGYAYATNATELSALPGTTRRALGLFSASHMSYELDRAATQQPALRDMAVKAVQLLQNNPNGYFLMVEGGRIDHALHETTAKKALVDTVAFDAAISAVLDEVRRTDPTLSRTLIVVTADHDHTLVHNGYAKRTGPTSSTDAGILGLVRDAVSGAPVNDADGRPFTILGFGNGERRIVGPRSNEPALTEAATTADTYHQEAAIRMGIGSETHGGTDVSLHAIGFGASNFRGFLTNTEVFAIVRDASKL